MRAVFLVFPLVLVGCKPDPIEACVEAERKSSMLELCKDVESRAKKCYAENEEVWVTVYEPLWRKKCMRAAAGKED